MRRGKKGREMGPPATTPRHGRACDRPTSPNRHSVLARASSLLKIRTDYSQEAKRLPSSFGASSALPNASVGIGAELQDRTGSGIRISVTEDLLDRRERVLTAAVARCDPLNFVGIV